ncbi:hypothetical protein HMI56_003970, partial [Coelomomyces lativittatus]
EQHHIPATHYLSSDATNRAHEPPTRLPQPSSPPCQSLPLPCTVSSHTLIWDSCTQACTAPVPLILSHRHHHPTPQPLTSSTTNIHLSILNPLFSRVSNITGEFSEMLLATRGTLYMEVFALHEHGRSMVYCSHPGYYNSDMGLPIKVAMPQEGNFMVFCPMGVAINRILYMFPKSDTERGLPSCWVISH